MPGAVIGGEPVPADGALPDGALAGAGTRPFGIYVHVPFCTTRCGYCDFNTYTATELGGRPGLPGAVPSATVSPATYAELVIAELRFASKVLGEAVRPASTVFFGGGTPTLLAPGAFGAILDAIGAEFGLTAGAEVTTEANPESVTEASLHELRARGITRVSFGMQSAVGHVLTVLDRTHQPGRPEQCVRWAGQAGFEHISLDLIYGTPGESDADWERSLSAAIATGPDHLSAYSLTVEQGTRLAARVRRGELTPPDDDVLAARYVIADQALSAAGYHWYEISNWAAAAGSRCAHNMLYWTGGDWWGIGPGAHSHVGGTRWWNVRHPAAYAGRVGAGVSPGQAREVLTDAERELERVMLGIRLADGYRFPAADVSVVRKLDGLVDLRGDRLFLTQRGRLLADTVVRALTG